MSMENQVELRKELSKSFVRYKKLMPGVGEAFDAMPAEAYKGGELDRKTKRLMALAVALTHGCRGCILAQTDYALEAGATPGEVFESCAVAISMGGSMAGAETARVVEYLDQRGLLEG